MWLLQINDGLHSIRHVFPNVVFGSVVIGSSPDDIYIMPSGTRLSPVNTVRPSDQPYTYTQRTRYVQINSLMSLFLFPCTRGTFPFLQNYETQTYCSFTQFYVYLHVILFNKLTFYFCSKYICWGRQTQKDSCPFLCMRLRDRDEINLLNQLLVNDFTVLKTRFCQAAVLA